MRQTILELAKLQLVVQGEAAKCKVSTLLQPDAQVETQLHAGAMSQEHFPPLVTKLAGTTEVMADASATDSSADEWPVEAAAAAAGGLCDSPDTWASITGKQYYSLFTGTALDHVSQVHPIFVAYKKVSWDGQWIPISEVASAVAHAVENADQIDGIQAMKSGWNIYMKTKVDRASLMVTGINLAGKHVSLFSSCRIEELCVQC